MVNITIIIIILLIAVWNGLVIEWYKGNMSSELWHSVGFIIRALLTGIIWYQSNWIWALASAFTCWIPYNIIINLIMKQKWYYIGQTSKIDKLLRKLFYSK